MWMIHMKTTKRKYGFKLSRPGELEQYVPRFSAARELPLPAFSAEMERMGIGPLDQGDKGACVCFSGVKLAAFIAKKTHPETDLPKFSPYFTYYNIRKAQIAAGELNSIDEDEGATGYEFMQSGKKDGLCPWDLWAPVEENYAAEPTDAAKAAAMDHQVLTSKVLPLSISGLRIGMNDEGSPAQIGMLVPPELESEEVEKTGILESIADLTLANNLGGHEVLLCDFLMKDGRLWVKLQNNWGRDWGKKGYWEMPATLLAKLLLEARLMIAIE